LSSTAPVVRPFFLEGPAGRLFCLHYAAENPGPVRRAVMVLPPFAEELNKCRRMLALAARSLQRAGSDVLLVDLYGTGDSAGDFADASLAVWRGDLTRATEWLAARGATHLDVLTVRGGALLLRGLDAPPGMMRGRIALWQPVVSGRLAMSQFLRLRFAERMASAVNPAPAPDVRAALRELGSIEVAGYEVANALVSGLEELDDPLADAARWTQVHWFEVVSEGVTTPGPASQRAIDALRARGALVAAQVVPGEPFWATPEIALVPGLLDATVVALGGAVV
jgi:exosortase A-associated hydrolase 2